MNMKGGIKTSWINEDAERICMKYRSINDKLSVELCRGQTVYPSENNVHYPTLILITKAVEMFWFFMKKVPEVNEKSVIFY